jgi:FkbM family methyltransferase
VNNPSTPTRDRHWIEARSFLQTHFKVGDRILAPGNFFPDDSSNFYNYTTSDWAEVTAFDWVVVHKGLTQKINETFLQAVFNQLKPTFVNEVFVIFSNSDTLSAIPPDTLHLVALYQRIKASPPKSLRQWLDALNPIAIIDQLQIMVTRLKSLEASIQQLERIQLVSRLPLDGKVIALLSLSTFTRLCRTATRTLYIGNDTLLCTILGKYYLYADSRDRGIVAHLAMSGYWEPNITLAVARILQPDWFCVDVGANHGYYALLMASVVRDRGRVVAIEPNPHLAQLIQQTIRINGLKDCTTVLTNAVSDQTGQIVQLVVPSSYTGNASIVADYGTCASNQTFSVETITIDQLTQDWERVDFIKIDVEGAEELTWRGMRQTLRKHPNIKLLLEFGAARYPNPRAFLEEIQAEGFVLRHVADRGNLESLSIDQYLSDRPDSHWDLLLMRSEK